MMMFKYEMKLQGKRIYYRSMILKIYKIQNMETISHCIPYIYNAYLVKQSYRKADK